jgi:hypothetical protein
VIEELKSGADDKALYQSGWHLNTKLGLALSGFSGRIETDSLDYSQFGWERSGGRWI